MVVVDFGAGSGSYAIEAAKIVAPNGRVYAIDIRKEPLDRLRADARDSGLSNIEIIWGDIEQAGGAKLADQLAEVVIISNVLFQARSMYTVALEAKRVLKQGGRIMVIDWNESVGGLGPLPSEIIPAEEVKKSFGSAGLSFVSEFPAGDHHYGLIFSK